MANKTDNKEALLFNVQQLREMHQSEFYLMVVGHEARERMLKGITERGRVPQDRIDAFRGIAGLLGEVIKRVPHSCKFYQLGDLSKVLLADNTPLGARIKNIYELYLFQMECVQIDDVKPPVLTGLARPYDLHCNRVGNPLEQKVTLYMAQTPMQKVKDGIMCL